MTIGQDLVFRMLLYIPHAAADLIAIERVRHVHS